MVLLGWLGAGLALTLVPARPGPGQVIEHNAVPFRTIAIYAANLDSAFWQVQLIGNVLFLLPVGLLGPVAVPWMDRWPRVLLAALLVSSTIEVAQLWIPDRASDVDDVIVNVAGAALGYGMLKLFRPGLRPVR